MSATMAESQDWSRSRWGLMIVLILAFHVGVIFWLSFRCHNMTTTAGVAPPVYVSAVPHAQWPGATTASQFVLANQHGFSRMAWLQIPALPYDLPEWTEPPLPLALNQDKLGGALSDLVQSDFGATIELAPRPDPQMEISIPVEPVGNTPSRLTVEGVLANRQLLSKSTLTAWPSAEILTNSVVQTGVDDKGTVVTAVLLTTCGSAKADAKALAFARSARFEPLHPSRLGAPSTVLAWGNMVFRWQTAVLPVTNTAPLTNP